MQNITKLTQTGDELLWWIKIITSKRLYGLFIGAPCYEQFAHVLCFTEFIYITLRNNFKYWYSKSPLAPSGFGYFAEFCDHLRWYRL